MFEQDLTVRSVTVTSDTLSVELSDGRGVSVPLAWFPRLLHGAPEERERWELIGRGSGGQNELEQQMRGILGWPVWEAWLDGRTQRHDVLP